MTALWSHSQSPNTGRDPVVDAFTCGDDRTLDQVLLPFDLRGTAAHVRGLGRVGVLSSDDVAKIDAAIAALQTAYEAGQFVVGAEHEDGHTAIEAALTATLGDLGKRVHTARSRNDQVLTALRLYVLDRMRAIDAQIDALGTAFEAVAARAGNLVMAGYTHGQPAMPLSVATWLQSFSAALADDRRVVRAVVEVLDQSPLGSAAGFGPPIPLDREGTARDLGFARVQKNPVYCQQSRPKFEALTLTACAQVAWTLGQFACDALMFVSRAYGFLRLPADLTTGSSLMPNKRNPDVLELLRALHPQVEAAAHEIRLLGLRLPSGYHRDFQATKAPFMRGVETTLTGLDVCRRVVERLEFDAEAIAASCAPEIYATARAHELVVKHGLPFRDAYRQVKDELFAAPHRPPTPSE